ncbi:4'-phosphopantetheinyl transferase superfamily protein [Synechococcus sp. HK01-R]|uniref:4'-phosphopantetheinyl transferase family protein n=1 Tax=Synechococcus sp. HK01-R TaxID=2751171 RepID=UPI001624C89E|nr:4'-phosphopantetheinyl transferase superfamily protein [Synechococcus sp. HK01-R]QNG27387.1 4-phosphopantetheinyl transferase family protein [Synechococcus sp. HK01-R]
MRQLLGELMDVEPLAIPLDAPPAAPPTLAPGWGCVSLSHCPDALLVGWGPRKLGVDLERRDRMLPAEALARRFFPPEERVQLRGLEPLALRQAVLDRWVIKEAAIKWQRGALAKDLPQWCCREDLRTVVHCGEGQELAVQGWRHGSWTLAMVQDSLEGEGCDASRQVSMLCLT